MTEEGCQKPFYQDVDGFRLPGTFSPEVFRCALKYKPKQGDLFVATYPKCGTTWMQQIVYLLQNRGQPTTDPMVFWSKSPFLEMLGIESAEEMARPGAIKTHLPFKLVPYSEDAKYIYVARNPKDALISFYHHTLAPYYNFQDGKFDDYFDIFIKGETDFGDYFDHLLSWYEHRNDPNVMIITFEELKNETRKGVEKIAEFMGKEFVEMLEDDEAILNNVLRYSSFEYMKTIFNVEVGETLQKLLVPGVDIDSLPLFPGMKHVLKAAAKFQTESKVKFDLIRKGIVGDWKNVLSATQSSLLDEKIEAKLKKTELYAYWKSLECI